MAAIRQADGGPNRFKELVLCVCALCDDPTKLGATKLNKALWYTDTIFYRMHGRSISGETAYIKRQFGPVPKRIQPTLAALQAEGALVVRETTLFGKPKRDFIPLRPATEGVFSDEELDVIRNVVKIICDNHTATSISERSHDAIWEAAEMGEEIPIYAVLAATAAPITNEDKEWADGVIQEIHGRA